MEDTTWLSIIGAVGLFSILLCTTIYFSSSRLTRRSYKRLGVVLTLITVSEITGFIGGFLMRVNMNPMYSVFNIAVVVAWLQFYNDQLATRRVRSIVNFATIAYIAFALTNFFFIQGIIAINSNSFAVASILKLILALFYFYLLIREPPSESITGIPMFWINAAVLLFSAGTLLINLSTDYLVYVLKDQYIGAFILNHLVTIVQYTLITIGLIVSRSKRTVNLYNT